MNSGASRRPRDLRLDFFRGLALWFIFVNHIPDNVVSWLSNRNYGFSDATEIFVYISGFSAALAYGAVMARSGFLLAGAKIWRRAWQIYVAHMLLFLAFTAEIAFVAQRFDNPMFADEMNVLGFLQNPDVTLFQALLLKFRPVNMDVLPLYIVLLAAFPPILWLSGKRPWSALGLSLALYVAARLFGWNLPNYPGDGGWFFNPFTWQLLFVMGTVAYRRPDVIAAALGQWRWLAPLAGLYLVFALAVALTWSFRSLEPHMPRALAQLLYPIDKTNLDALRIVHFLALAYLAILLVRPGTRWVGHPVFWPLVVCGQQGLAIFCVGTFLAFTGHSVLVEVSDSVPMQIAVSVSGFAIMTAIAALLAWYKAAERREVGAPRTGTEANAKAAAG